MPFVNAHTHIYSGLVPLGMPAPQPAPRGLPQILERIWWRLDRALDEDILRASADWYVARSALLGTGVLIDHHESPEFIEGSLSVLAAACAQTGMPAVLTYGVTERNRGTDEARAGLAENRRFLESCAHQEHGPLVRGAGGLHACFSVSDETIRAAGDLAAEFSVPLHLHVAEDPSDVADARRRGYRGVIERLDKLGVLVPGTLLAHGVHLELEEVQLADERGAWFMHNPRSNRANGVGYASQLRASGRVALGSDGFPSDMTQEQKALSRYAQQAQEDGAEGEVERASARLAAGKRLAREIFGADLPAPPTPDTERLQELEAIAKTQAQRLWTRMAAL